MHRSSERGNAVVFILIAIALFAALAYTFMRSAQQGQGNLSAGQAKFKAQELASFFQNVERGIDKLRQRGCSINDISFAYPGSISGLSWLDDPANPPTAPLDKSCHVFDPAGANVTMNVKISDFQAPLAHIPNGEHAQYNHMAFNGVDAWLGPERVMGINFMNPEICKAYNMVINNGVDYSIVDIGSWTSATSFCFQKSFGGPQNGGDMNQAIHTISE